MHIPTTEEIDFVDAASLPASKDEAVLVIRALINSAAGQSFTGDLVSFGTGYWFGLKIANGLATKEHDPAIDSWFFGTYEPEFYRHQRASGIDREHYIRAVVAEYAQAQARFEEFHAIARAEDEGMIATGEEHLG